MLTHVLLWASVVILFKIALRLMDKYDSLRRSENESEQKQGDAAFTLARIIGHLALVLLWYTIFVHHLGGPGWSGIFIFLGIIHFIFCAQDLLDTP